MSRVWFALFFFAVFITFQNPAFSAEQKQDDAQAESEASSDETVDADDLTPADSSFDVDLTRVKSAQDLPPQMQPGRQPFNQQVQDAQEPDAQGLGDLDKK